MSEIETGRILPTKILAKQIAREEKVIGGIIIPSSVKDPNLRATVVLTGAGIPPMGMPVEKNQTVIFSPHAAQRVKIGEDEYLVLDVRDVLFYF